MALLQSRFGSYKGDHLDGIQGSMALFRWLGEVQKKMDFNSLVIIWLLCGYYMVIIWLVGYIEILFNSQKQMGY